MAIEYWLITATHQTPEAALKVLMEQGSFAREPTTIWTYRDGTQVPVYPHTQDSQLWVNATIIGPHRRATFERDYGFCPWLDIEFHPFDSADFSAAINRIYRSVLLLLRDSEGDAMLRVDAFMKLWRIGGELRANLEMYYGPSDADLEQGELSLPYTRADLT